MRLRASLLVVALAVGAIAAGIALLDDEVGVRAAPEVSAGSAPTGAWYCPHGGGTRDWSVKLSVTNPGARPVPIRVRSYSAADPAPPRDLVVEPGSVLRVAVRVQGRAAGSVVESFGGWVGVGWVAVAGGPDAGTAAEPCSPTAGDTWLLPDGTSVAGQDAWVVVMNPFASEAVVGLDLLSEDRTVRWGDVSLAPGRVRAFHVSRRVAGERTVAAIVRASLGRVTAASIGLDEDGGVRAAIGVPAVQGTTILPGAVDPGHSLVPVLNPSGRGAAYAATVLGEGGSTPAEDLTGEPLGPTSVRTEDVVGLEAPYALAVRATEGAGVSPARRTPGLRGDQGSTAGGTPAVAWVVGTSQGRPDDVSRVVLANPGPEAVDVTVTVLGQDETSGDPLTVEVPPGGVAQTPVALFEDAPFASVLAVADGGTFVAASASYSQSETGYAVTMGVPVPDRWVPEA